MRLIYVSFEAGYLMTLSKWILRVIGGAGMGWTDLAQDRNQWRAPVNTIMNLRVP
jgi:hypothetical protein